MSITRHKLIFVACDDCGTLISPPPSMAATPANVRLIAANNGWKKIKAKDICCSCVACRARESQEEATS